MIVFHGTTARRARQICRNGFLPKKPSRRVWFAESRLYAERRGLTQARRSHDRTVVLTCDLNLDQLRRDLGPKRVMHRNRVIAVDGVVNVSVLRSWPASTDVASSPRELATWINHILRVKQHHGVSPKHDGVQRLSRLIVKRLSEHPEGRIKPTEIIYHARQCLPGFLGDVEIDPKTLHARPRMETIHVEIDYPGQAADEREYEALELLEDQAARRRIRGLKLLEELEEPDLFEWCAILLDDESIDLRVLALETIARCQDADPDALAPFAECENKRVRAAAIAALTRHGGEDASRWFRAGLTDPSANVRMEAVSALSLLNPAEHKDLFELALYDPNPRVRQHAERLTQGKGFRKWKW